MKVVPIFVDADWEATKTRIQSVNAVLMMGGSEVEESYYAFAKNVFAYVKQLNDNGTALPIWGTCLGF